MGHGFLDFAFVPVVMAPFIEIAPNARDLFVQKRADLDCVVILR